MTKGVLFVRRTLASKPWPRWYVYAWRGGPCVKTWDSHKKPLLGKAELKAILAAREAVEVP